MPGKRKLKNIFINFQADSREGKDQVYVSLLVSNRDNLSGHQYALRDHRKTLFFCNRSHTFEKKLYFRAAIIVELKAVAIRSA